MSNMLSVPRWRISSSASCIAFVTRLSMKTISRALAACTCACTWAGAASATTGALASTGAVSS